MGAPSFKKPSKVKTSAAVSFLPQTSLTFTWIDCDTNGLFAYEIHEKTNVLGDWVLIGYTTETRYTVPIRPGLHLFGVRAIKNGMQSDFANKLTCE